MLPSEARILFLGEAAPLHLQTRSNSDQRIVYTTVWSRGPLEQLILQGGTPPEWVDGLRTQGFTHVMIHPSMLERWHRSGWLASELAIENLSDLSKNLRPIHRFKNGAAIFQVPPPTPTTENP